MFSFSIIESNFYFHKTFSVLYNTQFKGLERLCVPMNLLRYCLHGATANLTSAVLPPCKASNSQFCLASKFVMVLSFNSITVLLIVYGVFTQLKQSATRGSLDQLVNSTVTAWMMRRVTPSPVTVTVHRDGRVPGVKLVSINKRTRLMKIIVFIRFYCKMCTSIGLLQ